MRCSEKSATRYSVVANRSKDSFPTAIFRHLAGTAHCQILFEKRQQALVTPGTKLLRYDGESYAVRHSERAKHESKAGVCSEMGSSRELKQVQHYSNHRHGQHYYECETKRLPG
jgi:hypothetical protein